MGGLTLSHAYRVMKTLWPGGTVGKPDLIPCIQGNGPGGAVGRPDLIPCIQGNGPGGAVGRPDLIPCIQGNGDTVARRDCWEA